MAIARFKPTFRQCAAHALAVALTAPASWVAAQNEPLPAVDASAVTASDQQQRQLQIFSEIVLNPSGDISSETRRNAARELVALNTPEAVAILDQALRSQKSQVMLAAISAMQGSPAPIEGLLPAALSALPTAPSNVIESMAWSLARYGSDALEQVVQLATDINRPLAHRASAIQALSAFDSQAAAATLINLADAPDEPVELVATACEALQRISGMSYGTNLELWRQWWSEAGSLPAAEWRAYITKSLSKRAAQLQQDLQKQRELNDSVSRELQAAYRDLYPALPIEEQLRRLPPLLNNPFAAVREFAVSRVMVLLRDSVRIPMEVQHRLAERLNDESSALRVQTARLLDELNYEAAGSLIAARLSQETSPEVVGDLLDVLQKRPVSATVEPARRWLQNAQVGDKAATLLWKVCSIAPLSNEITDSLRNEVRAVMQIRSSREILRLLALIGADSDVARLSDLLDSDDPSVREAIADGYRQRGLRQPLVDRADDAVIYPYALRALCEGSVDLGSFRMLVGLKPSDSQSALWNECVTKAIAKLTNGQLIGADDILAATSYVNGQLRQVVLNRALSMPREELSADHRLAAVTRLAPMLLEQNEPGRAYALLEGVSLEDPRMKTLYFHAAALAGQYERALEVRKEPRAWVELLQSVSKQDASAAGALCREIERRFAGRLSPEDQATVNAISEIVRQAQSASATLN